MAEDAAFSEAAWARYGAEHDPVAAEAHAPRVEAALSLEPWRFTRLSWAVQEALGTDVLRECIARLGPCDAFDVAGVSPSLPGARDLVVCYVMMLRPDLYADLHDEDRAYEAEPELAMAAATRAVEERLVAYDALPERLRDGFGREAGTPIHAMAMALADAAARLPRFDAADVPPRIRVEIGSRS